MRNGLISDQYGNQFWYKDDKYHRDDDFPAVIRADGTYIWYIDGIFHRENGPAVMYTNGVNFWWLDGVNYDFDEWCLELNKSPKEKAFLALKYLE